MIDFRPVIFILGAVLSKLALFMYIPLLLSFFTGAAGFTEFLQAVLLTHFASFVCIHRGLKKPFTLSVRTMFLLTTTIWVVASVFAALPFVFINHISFTDAYFETMSGITTTGSTVLSGLDTMAPSILLWRSLLQWLGGVGFIVMAVAVLPFLNVGGMRLFQTESSDWSDKASPRTETIAKGIVLLYFGLTALCAIAYSQTGMTGFEAINHAMTTLSTGGYSTSDASMANFSHAAHWVAIVFMFLGGLPFILIIQSFRRKRGLIWQDEQVKGFFILVLLCTFLMTFYLYEHHTFSLSDSIRLSLFNILSLMTTTGFGLTDFSSWSHFTTILFCFLMFCGACSGSTAGGFKIFRIQIAGTLMRTQFKQLVHPSGVFTQRYNNRPVSESIIRSLVAFSLVFVVSIMLIAALLGALGLTPITAISGAITAVCNVGPGLGSEIGPTSNFAHLPAMAKWILSFGMLLGRLEILTVLVIFSPTFWRY